jgi:2-acylglycerol O-acyltransferase 2
MQQMSSEWHPVDVITPNPPDMPSKTYADAVVEPPPPKINGVHDGEKPAPAAYSAVKSPGEYTGSGILDAPTSPARGHKRLGSRSSRNSLKAKEVKKKSSDEENGLVYEKYQDGNGAHLTSLKSTEEYEEGLKQDKKELQHHSPERERKLASGRVAAAGWERSG